IAAIVEGTPAEVPMADAWVTAGLLLGLLFGWVYQAAMLRAPRQATYGMRAAGLFVTTTKGDPVSFARATLRHACKALNCFYGLGLLLQLVTMRRQALHDWLSGTVVLSRPAASPAAIPIHEVHIVR